MDHDVWPVAEQGVLTEFQNFQTRGPHHRHISVCGFKCTGQPMKTEEKKIHTSRGWGHPSLPLWKLCPWGAGCPQEGALAPPSPLPPPANTGEKGRMLVQGFLSSEVSWNLWSGGQVSVGMTPSVSSWSKLKQWWRIQRNWLHRRVDGD